MADVPQLVACETLKSIVEAGSHNNVVVLDVSWFSDKDALTEYQREHIPGSRYMNVMTENNTEFLARNIPTKDEFQARAREAGLNNDSHVIVYSNTDALGFFLSGRAWWTFKIFGHDKVSILNGGLLKWKSLGYPVSKDEPSKKVGHFTAKWNASKYLSFEEMMKVDLKGRQIGDSRKPELYRGAASPGHIPQAKSIPLGTLLDHEKGTLKSKDDLTKVFQKQGVDLTKPLLVYCNSGMSSTTLLFSALLCGCPDGAVYHGGFIEWKKRAPTDKIES